MQINALFAGKPQPFGSRNTLSSIIKYATPHLTVTTNGTLEDEQGNRKLHGGPEKVLHQYSVKGYELLRRQYPSLKDALTLGSIGENMIINDMTDSHVHIGDVFRIGGAIIQVSAPRAPCVRICQRYGHNQLDQFVGLNGITGWYYRVLEEGMIRVNDSVHHIERPAYSVSVNQLVKTIYGNECSIEKLQSYRELTFLDTEWRNKCARRAAKICRES